MDLYGTVALTELLCTLRGARSYTTVFRRASRLKRTNGGASVDTITLKFYQQIVSIDSCITTANLWRGNCNLLDDSSCWCCIANTVERYRAVSRYTHHDLRTGARTGICAELLPMHRQN